MSVTKNNNEACSSIDKKWMLCMVASFVGCIFLTVCLDYTNGGELNFWGFGTSSAKNITLIIAASGTISNSDITGIVPAIETEKSSSNKYNASEGEETELKILRSSKSFGQGGIISAGKNEGGRNNISEVTAAEILLPPISSNGSGIVITDDVRKEEDSSNNSSEVTAPEIILHPPPSSNQSRSIIITDDVNGEEICNMFEGAWVHEESPNYYAGQCPFLSGQVSCRRNGRPDSDYERWSWEAKSCRIPRFDGTNMLERLRGKRMIIVGDSLNRNQWESLACLLYSSINNPSRAYVDVRSPRYKVFKAKDHDCTVEFYWNPFLVQLDTNGEGGRKVLRLDKVAETAKLWKGADVMVFNTGHWWVHRGKMQAWDLFQYRGHEVDIEVGSALELALKTWSKWIHRNVDMSKTTVFFRSISPEHKGKFLCNNQTELIKDGSYVLDFPRQILNVIEQRIQKMGTKVNYLNITKLSQYRKDGHPSIYARKDGIKPEKRLQIYSDCSHWCLPGLPDTWNRLVYAHLFLNKTSSWDISD